MKATLAATRAATLGGSRPLGRGLALFALVGLLIFPIAEASARGGFSGGGFRSAPSFRPAAPSRSFSPPRTAAPRTMAPQKTAPASTPSTAPKTTFNWGSRVAPSAAASAATQPRLSPPAGAAGASGTAASRSLYDTAKSKGTLYSNQGEAATAFRQSYGSSYSSTFATQPNARPNYIPGSTYIGGRSYPIAWNSGLGGYGYYDNLLGRWILYDALSDAAMAATLMGNHGYWWGAPPVYVSHTGGFVAFAVFLFLLFCLICVAVIAVRAARSRSARDENRGS